VKEVLILSVKVKNNRDTKQKLQEKGTKKPVFM